jgi:hypothetical protein
MASHSSSLENGTTRGSATGRANNFSRPALWNKPHRSLFGWGTVLIPHKRSKATGFLFSQDKSGFNDEFHIGKSKAESGNSEITKPQGQCARHRARINQGFRMKGHNSKAEIDLKTMDY